MSFACECIEPQEIIFSEVTQIKHDKFSLLRGSLLQSSGENACWNNCRNQRSKQGAVLGCKGRERDRGDSLGISDLMEKMVK